jgi:hypothetical protein
MSDPVLATSRRFAAALDAEDYLAAGALLAAGCVYHTGGEPLRGPEAILASYRASGAAAAARFEAVQYTSAVRLCGPSVAVVTFTDRVRRRGRWHEYRCRQRVRVGAAGLIVEIRHEELPGERERLREFEEAAAAPRADGSDPRGGRYCGR